MKTLHPEAYNRIYSRGCMRIRYRVGQNAKRLGLLGRLVWAFRPDPTTLTNLTKSDHDD